MFDKKIKMMDLNRTLRETLKFQIKLDDNPMLDFEEYRDYITVRGEVNYHKSRIIKQANTENTKDYLVFVIRYRTDILTTMRILFKNNPYLIESVTPLNRENLYLEVVAYKYNNNLAVEP